MITNGGHSAVDLSIVATLYKSAPYVDEFYKRITAEAEKITVKYEIIFVDDGSPDNSLEKVLRLSQHDDRVRVIELSKNFGHHKAMMTGLDFAVGGLVFLIDIDLEEPPELLSQFHELMEQGSWDVVYGCQESRKGGVFEKWSGAFAWWIVEIMLPDKIPNYHSTVRLMKKSYVDALVLHKEHKTAIGGLWVLTGFKQTGIKFVKLSRRVTSYPLSLRLIVLLDSITSFSERPLYLIFGLGLSIIILACAVSFALFLQWCSGKVLPGWVSVMVSVWLLGGLGIFSIGVVGLYVSRIFIETKDRPYTIVRKIYPESSSS